MKLDSSTARQYAAILIIVLAALVTAFLLVFSVVSGQPLSPLAETLGGVLLGFATHELGVSRGSSISQQSASMSAAHMWAAQTQSNPTHTDMTQQQTMPLFKEPEGSHVG